MRARTFLDAYIVQVHAPRRACELVHIKSDRACHFKREKDRAHAHTRTLMRLLWKIRLVCAKKGARDTYKRARDCLKSLEGEMRERTVIGRPNFDTAIVDSNADGTWRLALSHAFRVRVSIVGYDKWIA